MKKIVLSLSVLAMSAFIHPLGASGIPTVDISAITQSILNMQEMIKTNAQLIKQYEAMIKQGTNQALQLQEQGIGMSVEDVLGQTKGIIDKTASLADVKLDENLFQETTDITNTCAFLEKESKELAEQISKASSKLDDKVNVCLAAVSSGILGKTKAELGEKYAQLLRLDENGINDAREQEKIDLRHKIDMMQQAENFLAHSANSQKSSKILAFYDTYNNGGADNPYSREKLDEDIKSLANQLRQSNNQKQAAALTNAMLLKLLEVANRQYDLSLNFYAMSAVKEKKENKPNQIIDENSYKQASPKYVNEKDTEYYQRNKDDFEFQVMYNDFGLPDYDAMIKIETPKN
ncbi:hypothetical protein DMB91_08420 [Campylobacter sp. MIT 97-5078]|nr:hypothetical protein [Campylobacter sp. MIT 97-5078]KGI55185.1 hypothetical protein LR59_13045 [Campylobacter sp. MIT 97-5078]TQR23048.1 hypothetical protein DMB91_08420 [Campylobacter sp. MIT 97-5078]